MSNTLFRKVIAAVSATAIAMSIVAPVNVSAYTAEELSSAQALAEAGVIKAQDSATGYNLGAKISRREFAKVTMKLSGKETPDTCTGMFSDLDSSDFGCKYAEAMVNNGFAAANATYRPDADVSKFETLKLVLKSQGLDKAEGYGDNFQAAYVQAALDNGIISESFTDYNTASTRGFVFSASADAIAEEEDEVELCEILGTCTDESNEQTSEETTEEETNESPVVDNSVNSEEDVLVVELSASTPNGKTVAGASANTVVAVYELTAGNSDVEVSNLVLERLGLGDKDTVTNVVLTDAQNGDRLSNNKSFNSSDDEANISLNSGYVVKAGETRMINVEVTVGAATDARGDRFVVSLMELSASSDVELEGSMESEEFEIASLDASSVTISADSSVTDPQLGDVDVEIFRFAAEMDSEDGTFEKITFEFDNSRSEDAFRNFTLLDDDKNVIAETATMSDEYLTFVIDGGFELKEDRKERFTVTADVIGEAGQTFVIAIDQTNDVTVIEDRFDSTAAVTLASNITDADGIDSITVEAGEITIVEMNVENDKIREDKDNIELAMFKLNSLAGKNLEIEEFGVKIAITAGNTGATKVGDLLENIELYDVTNSRTYDLSVSGVDNTLTEVFEDDNISIALKGEPITYVVRADTLDNIANFDSADITASFTTGNKVDGNGGLYIIETEDDEAVTDITPGSITFKQIDGSESGATLSNLSLSNSNAVVGSKDVEMIKFQIEADESSSIDVEQLVFSKNAGTAAFDRNTVAQLSLYKNSVSEANLLDTVSGSEVSSDATFNDFKVEIPANEEVEFILTADLVKDTSISGNLTLQLDTSKSIVRDVDADDVTLNPSADLVSNRTLTITGLGTLAAIVDTTDVKSKDDKVILAGTSMTDYVASYELTATNEAILVEELTLNSTVAGGDATEFTDTVEEVLLIANDGVTVIDSESVSSTTVEFQSFSNGGFVVEEGSENVYVKLRTAKIGKNNSGKATTQGITLDLDITEAQGNGSDEDLALSQGFITLGGTLEADDTFTVTTADGATAATAAGSTTLATAATTLAAAIAGVDANIDATATGATIKVVSLDGTSLNLSVATAENGGGAADAQTIVIDKNTIASTEVSKEFRIYPVSVATPAYVATSDTTLDATFDNKEVARFQLKAAATTNTKSASSTVLKTEVEKVRFRIDSLGNLGGANAAVITLGGSIEATDEFTVVTSKGSVSNDVTGGVDLAVYAAALRTDIDVINGLTAIASGTTIYVSTDDGSALNLSVSTADTGPAAADDQTITSAAAVAGSEFTLERVSPLDSSNNSVRSTLINNTGIANLLEVGDVIEFDTTSAFGTNKELSTSATEFIVKLSGSAVNTSVDSNVRLEMLSGDNDSTLAGDQSAIEFGDDNNTGAEGYSIILTQDIESFSTMRYDAD